MILVHRIVDRAGPPTRPSASWYLKQFEVVNASRPVALYLC